MPFERPTLSQLDDRIRNDIVTSVRIPGTVRSAAVLNRSVAAVLSRVYGGACHGQYGYLAWLAEQRFVHSMEGEFLDSEGQMYGMARTGEEAASGFIIVTGNNGAAVPAERYFQHEIGGQYRVTADAVIEDGAVRVHLAAVTPGAAGNLAAGETLRPVSPIEGIHTSAVVDENGIAGGVDVESDESYRERILARKRLPPHGGAAHDYVAWAKEVPGVTRAWCLPMHAGFGTVGVMFMRDADPTPFPNEEQCRKVAAHLETVRPVTAEVLVFPPEEYPVDIAVKVAPYSEFVHEAVKSELDDFLYREGDPDAVLYVSRLSEAISLAAGEHNHELISPVNDIHVPKNAIPTLGSVLITGREG